MADCVAYSALNAELLCPCSGRKALCKTSQNSLLSLARSRKWSFLCCRLLEQRPTHSAGARFEVAPSVSAQLQCRLCDGTYRKFGAKKFQIHSRAGLEPWGLR
jgi:hypothetical protein